MNGRGATAAAPSLRPSGQARRGETSVRRGAGKPLAQAGEGLLERCLRARGGAAQGPRRPHEPKSLLGNQRLGRLEPAARSTARVARKRWKSRRKEDLALGYIRPLS